MKRAAPRHMLIMSAAATAVLSLSACQTASMVAVVTPIAVQKRHINVANASYAAVDMLTQQTSKRIDPLKPFHLQGPYELMNEKERDENFAQMDDQPLYPNPTLGRVMADQMRTRLMQLGLRVVESAPPAADGSAGYNLAGTYRVHKGNFFGSGGSVDVHLRLIERAGGLTISTYDYTMPLTDEIRQYLAAGHDFMPPFWRD